MSSITKEFARDIIRGHGYGVAPSAVEALARIALASLESEAVAYVMADDLKDSSIISTPAYRDLGEAMERTVGDVVALYAVQPAPVSVPDELAGKSFNYIANKFQVSISEAQWILVGWNARSAAVLTIDKN